MPSVACMYDAPRRVVVRADERGPMQVGPHGEGELQVLVRMLCAVAGGVVGAFFAASVVSNFDRHCRTPGWAPSSPRSCW